MNADYAPDDFQDYIQDVLISHIAAKGQPDFILKQGDDLVYVDVENLKLYLMRISEAEVTVPVSLRLPEMQRGVGSS